VGWGPNRMGIKRALRNNHGGLRCLSSHIRPIMYDSGKSMKGGWSATYETGHMAPF
jgi:hypothetical protein